MRQGFTQGFRQGFTEGIPKQIPYYPSPLTPHPFAPLTFQPHLAFRSCHRKPFFLFLFHRHLVNAQNRDVKERKTDSFPDQKDKKARPS